MTEVTGILAQLNDEIQSCVGLTSNLLVYCGPGTRRRDVKEN